MFQFHVLQRRTAPRQSIISTFPVPRPKYFVGERNIVRREFVCLLMWRTSKNKNLKLDFESVDFFDSALNTQQMMN